MVDENGRWLEEEIAAYMKYRLPELAVSGSGVLKEAEQAAAQTGKVCLHSDTPHGIFPVSGFSAEKGRAGNLPAL